MMLRSLLVGLMVGLAILPTYSQNQNLVPNPSFEQYSQCPQNISLIEFAEEWKQPNQGTTDLLNSCSRGPVTVPNSIFGYQQPRTGQGYAGIHPYDPTQTYREYVQVKLTQALVKDSIYHVEFFVSLSNRFHVAIRNLGAYLSVVAPRAPDHSLLYNVTGPQVRHRGGYLDDTLHWVKIEGNFVAEGNEQYLTIGNFDDDAHTHLSSIGTSDLPYYFIDDVSVSLATCGVVTDLGPDVVLCPGGTFQLDATSKGASYRWQDGSTLPTFRVVSPGLYWVEVQRGSCTLRDSVRVAHLPEDRLKDTTLCPGQSYYLNAAFPGATGYRWQDGTTGSSFMVSEAGSYGVEIQFDGCSYYDQVTISYWEPPNRLPDHLSVCPKDSVLLDITMPGASYRWQDGSTKPTFLVTGPGYYSVEIQLDACTFYNQTRVDFLTPVQLFDVREIVLCRGASTLLSAAAFPGPFRWQDGSTNATLQVDGPGTYWVECYANGCLTRDSIVVKDLVNLPGNILSDTTLCTSSPLYLNASFPGAISYRWPDGSRYAGWLVSTPGTYWVDIELGGCTYRDSVRVDFLTQPNRLPDYTLTCGGEPVLLDATTEGAHYRWQDGSTEPTFLATRPGDYAVEIQVGACHFTDYAQVEAFTAPRVFRARDITLCAGETKFLDASWLEGAIRWQDGSTQPSYLVTQSGVYWVDFSFNGCAVRDSVTVHYPGEVASPFPKAISLCAGEVYLLDASELQSTWYQWQDGSTAARFQVSKPGSYWVEIPWGNCTLRYATTVSYSPLPLLTLRNDTALCYGSTLVLEAVGNNQRFSWSDHSTGAFFTVQSPGEYWVEGQDQSTGCVARQGVSIQQVECWAKLEIPNVITPNGDEKNEYFYIEGINDHWGLEIFNRWGQRVYQVGSYYNDWDGQDQVNGVYYYQLQNWVSGQRYQGWLQVLR